MRCKANRSGNWCKVDGKATVLCKLKLWAELIMLSHSFFSLPYALLGLALAGNVSMGRIVLILLAAFFARSAANSFNRFADAKYDKLNKRTSNRTIPSGKLSSCDALVISLISVAIMIACVLCLGAVPITLLPFAISLILLYSLTKRFTALCHFVLGLGCALTVLGACIAANGEVSLILVIIYFAAALQIAGFDIIYSTSDINFDRKKGLFSIPARFGRETALNIACIVQISATLLFFLAAFHVGKLSILGCIFVLICVALSQYSSRCGKIYIASYKLNGLMSVIVSTAFIIDIF